MTDDTKDGDFKSLGTRWLFSQGVSTVLLFVIAVGLWKAVPFVLEKVEAMSIKHATDLEKIQDKFDRVVSEQQSVVKDLGVALDKNTAALDSLRDEMKERK